MVSPGAGGGGNGLGGETIARGKLLRGCRSGCSAFTADAREVLDVAADCVDNARWFNGSSFGVKKVNDIAGRIGLAIT